MLPIVLGGIAVAAAGYTLKKRCEEDSRFCDKLTDKLLDFSDWMENAEQKLMGNDDFEVTMPAEAFYGMTPAGKAALLGEKVFESSLKPYMELLSGLEHVEGMSIDCSGAPSVPKRPLILSEEEMMRLERYRNTLTHAHTHLTRHLSTLMQIVSSEGRDVACFDDKQRQTLEDAHLYAQAIAKLLNVSLTDTHGKINPALDDRLLEVMHTMMKK